MITNNRLLQIQLDWTRAIRGAFFAIFALGGWSISFDSSAAEYDIFGNCPADLERPSDAEEIFSIVGEPDLYLGAFDDTEMDLSVSESLPMHTQFFQLSAEEGRIEVMTRRNVLDERRVCAWLNSEDVLNTDVEALEVGNPVDWLDPVTGKTKKLPNPLKLKAILRTNPEFSSDEVTEVAIHDKPNITSTARTKAIVFGIYLIYAERETENGYWYWIAGEDASVPTKFSGWVPDHYVHLWESQLSLYFNDSDKDGLIYASRDHAATADASGVLGEKPDVFYERSLGPERSDLENINIARFPILNEEAGSSGRGQSIYRIGFFGEDKGNGSVEFDDGTSSGRSKLQQSITNVDILFLIDNTLSMTEYFNSVVQAVQNSSDEINRINSENGYDIKVKFAAAIYGDYLSDSAELQDMQFKIVSGLGLPGVTRHLDKLTKIASSSDSYYRDAIADRPEGGLGGIVRGVNELQWTSDALFKVVVWIGDHGSRNAGDRENVSVADVKQTIIDNNVFLLPINVSGRYDAQWNEQFIRQGNQISDDGRGLRTLLAHNGGPSDDYDLARTYIEQSIATMFTSSLVANTSLREATDISQTIEERPELLDLGIPAAQADVLQISQSICQMAFGSKGCQSIQQQGQFMTEGFVRVGGNESPYTFWVNMPAFELEVLQRVLEQTCKGFERNQVKREVERAMQLVQSSFSGERYRSDLPIGEYLRRFFLLPRGHFPSFLESTPERIEELWQDARDMDLDNGNLALTTQIADPICRSATMLDLVINSKRVNDPLVDIVQTSEITGRETYTWSIKDEGALIDFDWEWAQGGENNYLYIPVDYLPGSVSVN